MGGKQGKGKRDGYKSSDHISIPLPLHRWVKRFSTTKGKETGNSEKEGARRAERGRGGVLPQPLLGDRTAKEENALEACLKPVRIYERNC